MDCWLLLIAKIQKMNVTSADDVCTFHFYTKSAQKQKIITIGGYFCPNTLMFPKKSLLLCGFKKESVCQLHCMPSSTGCRQR